MIDAMVLASLLPVIPQPERWQPAAGECDLAAAPVVERVDGALDLREEGYRIELRPGGVEVFARDARGLVWARSTLAQLRRAGAKAACGVIDDAPKYRVRGFTLDVGRMFHSLDFLRDLARTMSYYKFNTLHLHLNDNAIEKNPNADWSAKYSAFRLESSVYPELTARDGHYTKREFREFSLFCRGLGIEVVPEFDSPAHALAFTRVRPDFASKQYGADHFDLDKADEIVEWLRPLFAEYMTGEQPVFVGSHFHVGTDEYNPRDAEKFRAFSDKLLRMVAGFGYRPCAWGALSHAKGSTPVLVGADITLDIWHNPFYQPAEALKAGYSVVSVPDGLVYIVPHAGYYYDYLNHRHLYEKWEPRQIGNYTVPDEYLPRLAGGKFALWNDLCGKRKDGSQATEAENWDRIFPALQTLGQKFWSGARDDQPWREFAVLANGQQEPEQVGNRRVFRLKP